MSLSYIHPTVSENLCPPPEQIGLSQILFKKKKWDRLHPQMLSPTCVIWYTWPAGHKKRLPPGTTDPRTQAHPVLSHQRGGLLTTITRTKGKTTNMAQCTPIRF